MSLSAVPDSAPRVGRLKFKTLREVRAEARPPFRVAGLIHSSLTGIVGEPYVGKSGLAAHLVASGLQDGLFLGLPWDSPPDRTILVTTDAGSPREYADRLEALGVEDDEECLWFVDGPPIDARDWAELREARQLTADSLVVIDNLTGFVPDLNSTKDAQVFFNAVERELCQQGVTVVLVAHKSEKSGPHGRSRTPMGTTAISAKLRHVVYVDTDKDGLRLTTRGNECGEPLSIGLNREGHAADFVVRETVTVASRRRSTTTLDRNAALAAWVLEHCQGLNKRQTAENLSAKYGGNASGHEKSLQPSRPLGQLVTLDSSTSSWSRKQ